ncbi:hypothetical protein [Fibrella aquatilis]|uniref:Uncharacterized protein n=1 Tax=Fibrella aquatilis TaxID=2817059 RepID=A0A939GAS4_9BACT|nr:hypothetical protein [Fibrella aquatilis]MBO0934378.1 hypothetical protein [Fibrella aquatilis]
MKHLFLNSDFALNRLKQEYARYGSLVIAVDFDNTLYDYHQQGLDCSEIIELLHQLKRINCTIVVWTASESTAFIKTYCQEHNIPIDSINTNPPFFTSSSPKIYYNELLDDRAGLAESYHRLLALVTYVANLQT